MRDRTIDPHRNSDLAGTLLAMALLGAALGAAPPEASGDAPPAGAGFGSIVALSGDVFAEPDGDAWRLGCADRLAGGQTVTTAQGASLAFLWGDVLVEVGEGTTLQVSSRSEGTPDLRLWSGRLRVVDSREQRGAPPFHVVTPHLETLAAQTDAEFWVTSDNGERRSRICARTAALRVERAGDRDAMVLRRGECTTRGAGSGLRYEARAPAERRLADFPACGGDIVGPSLLRFSPGDVAAPLVVIPTFPPPFEVGGVLREPCEAPGFSCDGGFAEPPGLGGGGFPGSDGLRFGEPPGLEGGPFPGGASGELD